MESEELFIEQLRSGQENAFKNLVETYNSRVLNTVLGFIPNLHDAEDITQDVFVEIYQSISSFRGDSRLSTWIHRVAASKSLEYLRYKKRKKRQAYFQSLVGLEDERSKQVQDNYNHPGLSLENKERGTILFGAIDKLPDKQKTAFILHKVRGLSQKEVADIMKTSVSAIESLLHRSKNNLKSMLSDYYNSDD